MNRRTVCFLLLFSGLIFGRDVFSQTDSTYRKNLENAAFRMIRATVEFLATDTKTFPEVQSNQCANCASYEDLETFIQQNKLLNADKLVERARRRAAQNIAQINQPQRAMNDVREFLIREITPRNREHRKALPTYAAFEQNLASIANSAGSGAVAGPQPTAEAPAEQSDGTDAESDSAQVAATPAAVPSSSQSNWFSMAGFALILSILNLGLVAYVAYMVVKDRKPQQSAREGQLESQIAKLNERLNKLEVRKNQPDERFQMNARLEALERAVQARDKDRSRPEKPAAPAVEVPLEVVSKSPEPVEKPEASGPANRFRTVHPPKFEPKQVYARTADLGDGFSAGSLLPSLERDTVFDIQVQSESQAVYRVSESPEAQRLALNDPYSYLNDACEYMTQPSPNSRIRTDQPGRLTLQGEKWKIVEKAKISFF
ncbi:hypothetical protein [Larkinella soli]|uniref:hypothetical protein n=1 Tax=Larkinella soli TaxID=1770527 RepID=UPI000FFB9E34|nr:hypothetical protein [Larkinella soli]